MKKRFLFLLILLFLLYFFFPFSLKDSADSAGRALSESAAFREVFSLSEEDAAEVFAHRSGARFL